jgi:hypothetical protein
MQHTPECEQWENHKGKYYFAETGVGGLIILKWTLEKHY